MIKFRDTKHLKLRRLRDTTKSDFQNSEPRTSKLSKILSSLLKGRVESSKPKTHHGAPATHELRVYMRVVGFGLSRLMGFEV